MIAYILLAASILLGVGGQIFLKHSTLAQPRIAILTPLFNEWFMLAGLIYFCSLVLYTLSLRSLSVSVAFPAVSASYVLVALASHYLWGSPFGLREVLALLLILSGILLLVSSVGSGALL